MLRDHDNMHDHLYHFGDGVSAAAIVGAFAGFLPVVATIGAIVWYSIMIYDWVRARRAKNTLAIAEAQAEETLTHAQVAAELVLSNAREQARELLKQAAQDKAIKLDLEYELKDASHD